MGFVLIRKNIIIRVLNVIRIVLMVRIVYLLYLVRLDLGYSEDALDAKLMNNDTHHAIHINNLCIIFQYKLYIISCIMSC